ncbi:uncharacterized protein LOC131327940 [Rhododendron vialii]|uniref:uncharacterized protein LOC131327940 n=1 Tax=Rhododendron vialii TaxID=182163 RepID=UPI00265F9B6A|nr:uncharacterized protein LOC131327940 [Rhododendron vialii]
MQKTGLEEDDSKKPAMEGSRSTVAMTAFRLPFEITIEILSRLPVKSLLRCKSVCKNWYDLIKTPHFISKHLQTHSTRNHTPLLETCFIIVNENDEILLIHNVGFNKGPINLDFPFLDMRNCGTWEYDGDDYFSIVGISLNEVFYWFAHVVPTDQVVVMSFDMGNEVFKRIRTPKCLHKTRNLTNWIASDMGYKLQESFDDTDVATIADESIAD